MKNLFTVILVLFVLSSIAQNDSLKKSNTTHSLGLHAGSTSGVGPSYRLQINDFKIQATFLPIVSENNTFINYGLVFGKDVHSVGSSNFFLYNGIAGFHVNYRYESYNIVTQSYEYENDYFDRLHVGLGCGIENTYYDNMLMSLMFGYGAYFDMNSSPAYNLAIEFSVMYQFE